MTAGSRRSGSDFSRLFGGCAEPILGAQAEGTSGVEKPEPIFGNEMSLDSGAGVITGLGSTWSLRPVSCATSSPGKTGSGRSDGGVEGPRRRR